MGKVIQSVEFEGQAKKRAEMGVFVFVFVFVLVFSNDHFDFLCCVQVCIAGQLNNGLGDLSTNSDAF